MSTAADLPPTSTTGRRAAPRWIGGTLWSMRVCHETIYQAIYQPGSTLVRPLRVSSPHHPSPLRTGRDHRRAQRRADQRRPRFGRPGLSGGDPPLPPPDRGEGGGWGGGLLLGRTNESPTAT